MHVMSNLEYSFMARELAPRITGKHLGRIRKLSERVYRLKIGSTEVLCELGVRIHETRLLEKSELTDKFVEKAGKELDNAKLLELRQINNDRILAFDFDKGSLVFEMFGQGNAILVRDGLTLCAASYDSWADRQIAAGAPYKPPKTAPSEKLELTDKFVIVSLMKLPLGKDYAAEALLRAGIDEKTPGSSLSEAQVLALEKAIQELQSAAKPYLFYKEGKMADFALAKLTRFRELEAREPATLSEAEDEYYSSVEQPNPKAEKLQGRLEKQKQRRLALQGEEKLNRQKGDLIYSHYQEVDAIIALAKAGRMEELEKKGKVNKKEKSVEIGLG